MVRLEAAMRKAEAAVLAQEEMEVGLLVKDFFDGPVEAVLHFFLSRPRSTTALCMCMCMCMHVHVACMVACACTICVVT